MRELLAARVSTSGASIMSALSQAIVQATNAIKKADECLPQGEMLVLDMATTVVC